MADTSLVGAFERFLNEFKLASQSSDISTVDALENLNLDGDDISDDYDFMEDADEASGNRRRTRHSRDREPRKKYMDVLQEVADRKLSEICVDLDDLATVTAHSPGVRRHA